MASIDFEHVVKVYDGQVDPVIPDLNLHINDKEFIILVGPSGCGKSTTLRMIAGLEEITHGILKIDGREVNDVSAHDRDIAMVFQSYALYPNMTVYKNIAFPLQVRKLNDEDNALRLKEVKNLLKEKKLSQKHIDELIEEVENTPKIKEVDSFASKYSLDNETAIYVINKLKSKKKYTKAEIDEKVREVSSILNLDEYLDRKPANLSGGQRQRVALGRAMVRNPKVFLLDEPLSNLDAKLRTQMRSQISLLHRRLNTTFVYVTHDQTEAMTIADRIAVFNKGVIQQFDTPRKLYEYPANKFVAGFIGSPEMNFISAKVVNKPHLGLEINNQLVKLNESDSRYSVLKKYVDKEVILGIRPERILVPSSSDIKSLPKDTLFDVKIDISEFLGSESFIYFNIGENSLVAKISAKYTIKADEKIKVQLVPERFYVFDKESEKTIVYSKF